MKILWDRLKTPGIAPLSPENPLMFMPGPFCGFPIPSSSRTCVVTKSPRTSPKKSNYKNASTLSYSNMGGFFGPEIRFAGYDGIVISGKASSPVYIVIEDEKVEIRDAKKFWGMGTDEFDKKIIDELGDRQFESCYIGPAGENLIPMACIINTAARSAGTRTRAPARFPPRPGSRAAPPYPGPTARRCSRKSPRCRSPRSPRSGCTDPSRNS